MTCKDCVHYERCAWFADKIMRKGIFIDFSINIQADKECEYFKNKADFVEVVRCEDCKHKGWVQEPCHGKTIDFCRKHDFCIHKNDFCSYGEREEKEKEKVKE